MTPQRRREGRRRSLPLHAPSPERADHRPARAHSARAPAPRHAAAPRGCGAHFWPTSRQRTKGAGRARLHHFGGRPGAVPSGGMDDGTRAGAQWGRVWEAELRPANATPYAAVDAVAPTSDAARQTRTGGRLVVAVNRRAGGARPRHLRSKRRRHGEGTSPLAAAATVAAAAQRPAERPNCPSRGRCGKNGGLESGRTSHTEEMPAHFRKYY